MLYFSMSIIREKCHQWIAWMWKRIIGIERVMSHRICRPSVCMEWIMIHLSIILRSSYPSSSCSTNFLLQISGRSWQTQWICWSSSSMYSSRFGRTFLLHFLCKVCLLFHILLSRNLWHWRGSLWWTWLLAWSDWTLVILWKTICGRWILHTSSKELVWVEAQIQSCNLISSIWYLFLCWELAFW